MVVSGGPNEAAAPNVLRSFRAKAAHDNQPPLRRAQFGGVRLPSVSVPHVNFVHSPANLAVEDVGREGRKAVQSVGNAVRSAGSALGF
ncbi:unnamed protein product [Vitrella brassicaformis CCMP3155]|uniref:Uncharacterized protein n=2 Tax=Vitrella brassicaformis TaxID=1169539 RepID=A0A0G4G222_VITBC|nr:unnamed protein product [Vitrella brassicaformis CCMP3155]|eukprot:CEM22101.1 unnamed protein product [Vitrella brassicaformis CCMP3155]